MKTHSRNAHSQNTHNRQSPKRKSTSPARRMFRRIGMRWWLAQAVTKTSVPLLAISAFCFLLSAFLSSASIITGNIQNTSGNAYVTNALFAPLSTPLASGTNIIASTPTNVVAAANGSFSVTLKQGNYLVTLGNLRHDSFTISVPDDGNTYILNSLITSALTYNYTYSPIYERTAYRGQFDGYVGLLGTVLNPSGLTASNLNLAGAVRFEEDAFINDSTAGRVWKFSRINITSNNVVTLGEATNIVNSLGTVPIGGIVAWDKSLPGVPALPANFVECNGQTISDAASPLNGQTLRNLNANHQFLRGSTSSGSSGGAATHVHLYSGSTEVEDGDTDVQANSGTPATIAALGHVHSYAGTTDSGSSLPPYTDMVWVIRIK